MSFIRRVAILPFEALIAALVIISGTLALFHVGGIGQDALSLALPGWLTIAINALYVISGVAMVCGMGFARADFEGGGLIGVASGAVIRGLALVWFVGWHSLIVVGLIFDAMIVVACAIRLVHLVKRKTLILAQIAEQLPDRRREPR